MAERFVIGPLQTNCYIYTDEKSGQCAVVDPAFPDRRLLDALKGRDVRYILLTHAHIDHIFGLPAVKELTGAPVVCHVLERDALCDTYLNLYDNFHANFGRSGIYAEPFTPVSADITVDTGECLTLGKSCITAMHTPGHTAGSVSYFTEREMFCGDFLFAESYGRVDFPGGSFADLVDSFKKVCALEGEYILYPGHQETTSLNAERQTNPLRAYLDPFSL